MNPPAASPSKMAFVFVSMPVGGAEDFALSIARYLDAEFQPHFVCLRELGQLGEEARAAGWPVHLAPFFPSKMVNPLNIRRFAAWLRQGEFQLVHSQNHHAHIFATKAARLAGIPSVVHQQKTLTGLPWRRRRIFRGCLERSDRVVALSQQIASDLSSQFGVAAEKVVVVSNAIDETVFRPAQDRLRLRRELGLSPEGVLVGCVARLHHDKNHAVIIEALARLAESKIPLRAVFIGDGDLRGSLESMVRDRGLEDQVIFAGRCRPVARWLQCLDAFLLASTWEGQPLALLQALSCRLPVLASRIEGNTAVLGAKHPGLFDPRDSGALATLLRRMEPDGEFRQSLLKAQEACPVPSSRQAAGEISALYSSLLR